MTATDNPALSVLLDACRTWLGLGSRASDPASVDWRSVGRLGFFHNLDPLLYRLAEQRFLPASAIPADLLATWESAHYRNFLFNSRALEVLERLTAEARRVPAEVVVFKGPATLARSYGEPALRIMMDLDVLVRPADLEPLAAIAGRLGFTATGTDHLVHTVLRHPQLALGLELHFDLWDFLLRRDELRERALSERVELQLDDSRFPAAPLELALVLDVAHLVNHDFRVNLRHWLDLAALLSKASPTLDWRALEAALDVHGLTPEFLLAVEVVSELFLVPPRTVPFFRPSGYGAAARRRLIEGLATVHRGAARPALRELSYRSGLGESVSYLRRRLLPTGSRARALAPGRSAGPALLALWRQAIQAGRRELGRWRASGIARRGDSIKGAVYARNRRYRTAGTASPRQPADTQ